MANEIYCVKCKKKTQTNSVHQATSGTRVMLKGTCAVCGTKKNKFI